MMFRKIRQFLIVLFMAFTGYVSGQQQPCSMYNPPAWVDVYNITYNSADVSYEGVAPNAWYEVTLFSITQNQTLSVQVTQNLTIHYSSLPLGNSLLVTVKASSCPIGPWGGGNSRQFSLPIFIPDEVCSLTPSNVPDNQGNTYISIGGNPATIPGDNFFICLPKVNLSNMSLENDVFHAYFTLNGDPISFFEFTLVADQDNHAHFPALPLSYSEGNKEIFRVQYFDDNGNPVMSSSSKIIKIVVSLVDQQGFLLELSLKDIWVQSNVLPVMVRLDEQVEFHAGANNCEISSYACSNPQARPARTKSKERGDYSAQNLTINPNPVRENLQINFDPEGAPVQSIRIVDATGKVLFHSSESDGELVGQIVLSTSDWRPGMYYVQIVTEQGAQVYPVVKTN